MPILNKALIQIRTLNSDTTEIVSVSRSAGSLRRVATSCGRTFLVLKGPATERFLEEGGVLGPAEIEELEGPVARQAGMALALMFLSRRERTEHEVRKALGAEGIENPDSIDYIVETLKRRNLLSDRRFASELIGYRMRHDPAGPALLRRKLAEAGVPAGITDELLEDAFPPGEEARIASKLASGRLARTWGAVGPAAGRAGGHGASRTGREKAVRRIGGFLTRRGFAPWIVGDICAGILRGEITGETDEQ
jgi:SOS response regulatory protein OraA/RecX